MEISYGEIHTPLLHLRKPSQNDAEALFPIFSDDEVLKYTSIKKHQSIADTQNAIRNFIRGIEEKTMVIWSVCIKPSEKPVGMIGILYLNHDHHFGSFASILAKEHHNKGIISEAHRAVIAFAFENTGLNRIESQFYEKHQPVEKMLIKSGMIREGILRENFLIENKYVNSTIYSITKNEYLKNISFFK